MKTKSAEKSVKIFPRFQPGMTRRSFFKLFGGGVFIFFSTWDPLKLLALQPAGRRDPTRLRIARQAFDDRRVTLACPHDLAEADLVGRPRQANATALAPYRFDDAGPCESMDDFHKVVLGNAVGRRDFRNSRETDPVER